jgi:hypothetical protein
MCTWVCHQNVIDFYKAKTWKRFKTKGKDGEEITTVILYFASQDNLLDALAKKCDTNLVRSSTPSQESRSTVLLEKGHKIGAEGVEEGPS